MVELYLHFPIRLHGVGLDRDNFTVTTVEAVELVASKMPVDAPQGGN
jgi:hypothetical protein